jgi:acylphosphatase
MQTRAKIIVKGKVQRVGYRDAVEKIAGKSKKGVNVLAYRNRREG